MGVKINYLFGGRGGTRVSKKVITLLQDFFHASMQEMLTKVIGTQLVICYQNLFIWRIIEKLNSKLKIGLADIPQLVNVKREMEVTLVIERQEQNQP